MKIRAAWCTTGQNSIESMICFSNSTGEKEAWRDILKCSWILLRIFMLCLLSTMLIASPRLPKRPVRPIRCRYVSLSGFPSLSTGRSKLITTDTCSTSIPDGGKHKSTVNLGTALAWYCMNCRIHSGFGFSSFHRAVPWKVNNPLGQEVCRHATSWSKMVQENL